MPKIKKNGDISGCYLMINYNAVCRGVFKITNDPLISEIKINDLNIYFKIKKKPSRIN